MVSARLWPGEDTEREGVKSSSKLTRRFLSPNEIVLNLLLNFFRLQIKLTCARARAHWIGSSTLDVFGNFVFPTDSSCLLIWWAFCVHDLCGNHFSSSFIPFQRFCLFVFLLNSLFIFRDFAGRRKPHCFPNQFRNCLAGWCVACVRFMNLPLFGRQFRSFPFFEKWILMCLTHIHIISTIISPILAPSNCIHSATRRTGFVDLADGCETCDSRAYLHSSLSASKLHYRTSHGRKRTNLFIRILRHNISWMADTLVTARLDGSMQISIQIVMLIYRKRRRTKWINKLMRVRRPLRVFD